MLYKSKFIILFAGLAVASLLLAACESTSPAATPVPLPKTVILTTNPTLGPILTDSKGRTLYLYSKDSTDTSNCTDQCATDWPPLLLPAGTSPTYGPGVAVILEALIRPDGAVQVSVNKMPVYYYAKDVNPGDALGQGVNGEWYVMNSSGSIVK